MQHFSWWIVFMSRPFLGSLVNMNASLYVNIGLSMEVSCGGFCSHVVPSAFICKLGAYICVVIEVTSSLSNATDHVIDKVARFRLLSLPFFITASLW